MIRHSIFFSLLAGVLCSFADAQTSLEKELFSYINSERSRENAPLLEWDEELHEVASPHTTEMAASGKARHTGKDGRQPHERVQDAGIFASRTAENVARDVSIESAHTMLMQSLGHRENILDPDFTHAAVAVVEHGGVLYVTELFIRKVSDYNLREARRLLLKRFNEIRQQKERPPLAFSQSLANVAQSHLDVQQKFDAQTPLLTMSVLVRQMRRSVVVNVYTSSNVHQVPPQVVETIDSPHQQVGIGFKRVRGAICEGGCYFIALIFS